LAAVEEYTARRLAEIGAAAVYEALGRRNALPPGIRPLWTGLVLAGPAFTVECKAADNLALHRAVAEAPPGAVLVAATSRSTTVPVWGDLLSTISLNKGLAGFVTDGAVRDSNRIQHLKFPVFCQGTSLYAPTKDDFGTLGAPIVLEGVQVRPGDWLVADGDGVVVVPASELDSVIESAYAVREREAEMIRLAALGTSTLSQLNLDRSS
jgi:4-hydroxy-4-methyl-2-oxoglutarate aldolase